MPRRQRVGSTHQHKEPEAHKGLKRKRPQIVRVIGRLLVWLAGLSLFGLTKLASKLYGADTPADNARRLRHILTRMGPTAIKAGQQLSVRADMFPEEFCSELSKLLDRMPPFPFEQAKSLVEQSLGQPIEAVFRVFDPEPIGSASISCVYQAELLDGRKVAVKVRRPGIVARIHDDLRAIGWVCMLLESAGIIRGGMTRHFRTELNRMITEELDFVLEARYTEIFRRTSKENSYVSAPKIYNEYCGKDVIVSEFVSGVFLSEILEALNHNNETALAEFRARGFDFEKLGKRMMRVLHWECYESLFFHADPHPANLIVRPDNTLIMIDFGSCGSVSGAMKRRLMSFHRQMMENDVHAMSQTLVSILEPLPHCDTYSFTNDLVHIFRRLLLANESKHAPWREKCTGWMWMRIISLTRKYNIPINLDTLRVFRATFMYDTIIYQLHPRIDPRKEFGKWAARYHQTNKKRLFKEMWQRKLGPRDADFTKVQEFRELGVQVTERLQKFLDTPKYNFSYGVGKVSFVVSTFTRTILSVLQLMLLFATGRLIYLYFISKSVKEVDFNLEGAIPLVFGGTGFLYFTGLVALVVFIRLRKILMRLDEIDVN